MNAVHHASASLRLLAVTAVVAALAAPGCARRSSSTVSLAPTPDGSGLRAPALRDGFEGPALAPFWRPGDEGSGRYVPGAVVLTEEHARDGRRSARITLREGDVAQLGDSGQSNERAGLDSG